MPSQQHPAPAERPDATQLSALLDRDLLAEAAGDVQTAVGPAPRRPRAEPVDASGGSMGAAKTAGAVGGGGALLYLLDLALRDPAGGGVPQVLAHLGPVLGIIYANAPVALTAIGVGWFLLREYRRDQRRHARQDRRLQLMFARLAQEQAATTRAVNGVRADVQALRSDVDDRFAGLAQEAEGLRLAVAEAGERLDDHGQQIAQVRARVDEHEELLRGRKPAAAAGSKPRGAGAGGRSGGRGA